MQACTEVGEQSEAGCGGRRKDEIPPDRRALREGPDRGNRAQFRRTHRSRRRRRRQTARLRGLRQSFGGRSPLARLPRQPRGPRPEQRRVHRLRRPRRAEGRPQGGLPGSQLTAPPVPSRPERLQQGIDGEDPRADRQGTQGRVLHRKRRGGSVRPQRSLRKLPGKASGVRRTARGQRFGRLRRLRAAAGPPKVDADLKPDGTSDPAGTEAVYGNRQGLPEHRAPSASCLRSLHTDGRQVGHRKGLHQLGGTE